MLVYQMVDKFYEIGELKQMQMESTVWFFSPG